MSIHSFIVVIVIVIVIGLVTDVVTFVATDVVTFFVTDAVTFVMLGLWLGGYAYRVVGVLLCKLEPKRSPGAGASRISNGHSNCSLEWLNISIGSSCRKIGGRPSAGVMLTRTKYC